MQRPRPPVGRVRPAFQQTPRLQRVDEGDHPARRDPQLLGDRVLGLPFGGTHGAQKSEIARLDVE